MHPGLHITEIRGLIISEFDTVGQSKELAALARTSTIFHDLALNALWEEQVTIMNLIRCMPVDIWESTGTLRRPLTSFEWERVFTYSRRIKSFRCRDASRNPGDPDLMEVYKTLGQSVPGEYLMPNLETLAWNHNLPTSSAFINLLFGPRVTSVNFRASEVDLSPLLVALEPRRTSLASVSLRDVHSGYPASARSQLSAFICGLTCLEHLSVGTLDWEALIHLGRLTTLQSLTTCLPAAGSFAGATAGCMFPNISSSRLYVFDGLISALIAVVRSWDNPPMQSLTIRLFQCADMERLGALYETIAAHCTHRHLHELDISIRQSPPVTFVHPRNIFRPLYRFTHLRTVWIGVPEGYDLDDAALSEMARAWPQIVQLTLWSASHYHARCTLLALYSLSQHCPCLARLAMDLDATHVPMLARDALRVRQQALDYLHVALSPVSDAASVGAFIALLFSNLRKVQCNWNNDHDERWTEVSLAVAKRAKQEDEDRGVFLSGGI
ncbi:hypothetical protein DFH06DRAFT_1173185 [Mycena polygramma]|nr:hypothetical protein DFH06DRAFT_1173185 [Mycena polygramma]